MTDPLTQRFPRQATEHKLVDTGISGPHKRHRGAATLRKMLVRALLIAALLLLVGTAITAQLHHGATAQAQQTQRTAQLAALMAARAETAHTTRTQRICGPETGWLQLADGTHACTTKHGQRTGQHF